MTQEIKKVVCKAKNIVTFAPLQRRIRQNIFNFLTKKFKGEMAEWSNAVVLKTIDLHGSGGSNPSLSAS